MKTLSVFLTLVIFLIPLDAYSRDTKVLLTIHEVLQAHNYVDKIDPGISLYFGDQKHAEVTHSSGQFTSNKKTNAFNKSDEEACQWVLLSALLSLQDRARKEGANAIINIVSYYKKNIYKSNSQIECHAGSIMAGVALRGEVVRVAE